MVLRYKYNRQKYKLWEYQVHVCTHISKVGKVDIWIRNKAVYDITHGSNIFHVLIMQRTWLLGCKALVANVIICP